MSDAGAQAAAREVLANVSITTVDHAHVIMDAIMAQAPDDNTHRRNGSLHVVEVTHKGERAPRAAVMPWESFDVLRRALAAPPSADTKAPPRRKKKPG